MADKESKEPEKTVDSKQRKPCHCEKRDRDHPKSRNASPATAVAASEVPPEGKAKKEKRHHDEEKPRSRSKSKCIKCPRKAEEKTTVKKKAGGDLAEARPHQKHRKSRFESPTTTSDDVPPIKSAYQTATLAPRPKERRYSPPPETIPLSELYGKPICECPNQEQKSTYSVQKNIPVIVPVCRRRTPIHHDVGTNKPKVSPSTKQYNDEAGTQFPPPVANVSNQSPDVPKPTIPEIKEQQTQAPSAHDASVETNKPKNKIGEHEFEYMNTIWEVPPKSEYTSPKFCLDTCQLANKLAGLEDRLRKKHEAEDRRKPSVEVNVSDPFVHAPCNPCLEKVREFYEQTLKKQEPPTSECDYVRCPAYKEIDCPSILKKTASPMKLKAPEPLSQTASSPPQPKPCSIPVVYSAPPDLPEPAPKKVTPLFAQAEKMPSPSAPSEDSNYQLEARVIPPVTDKPCPKYCDSGDQYLCPGLKKNSSSQQEAVVIRLTPRRREGPCCVQRKSRYHGTGKGADSFIGLSEVTSGTKIWRMLFAEFLGTLLLVYIGCGSILLLDTAPTTLEIALCFGFVVGSVVQAICHISGGHINPAVTISFFVVCEMKLLRAILYIVCQLLGALAGAGLLHAASFNHADDSKLGVTTVPYVSPAQGFLAETVFTFLLVLVIHSVVDPRRKDVKGSAPLAIGIAVACCHISGIKFSGSSMNPARSFGPAVIANSWAHHWVYWAGPILGGVLAALVYRFFFKVRKDEDESYDF